MATKTQRIFETHIDIPEHARETLVGLLNARLADSFDLYSQLKQAHWNVKGTDFIQLHELYDEIAESVLPFVDDIAERATALGGLARGTARMAAQASALSEYPLDAVDAPSTSISGSSRRTCSADAAAQTVALTRQVSLLGPLAPPLAPVPMTSRRHAEAAG